MAAADPYAESRILIEDACSMYRRSLGRNDRPFDAEIKKLNNALVDEIKEKLLRKLADVDGALPSGLVVPVFRVFQTGKEMKATAPLLDTMYPAFPAEVTERWKTFFETATLSSMHELGIAAVEWGWTVINHETKRWILKNKLEKIYDTDDPFDWWKKSGIHSELAKGLAHPFWSLEQINDIREKVSALVNLPLGPSPPAGAR